MRLRCIIVEDEPLAMERARDYVARLPYLELVATCTDGVAALAALKAQPVDLLILDIQLGELTGIQLLEAIRPDCAVVITTAYDAYALKGYELAVTDYLLKPYGFDRFVQAMERALAWAQTHRAQPRDHVFVKVEGRLERVHLPDLLYIEGMRDYRRIHLRQRRIMTLQTFGELEEMIPARVAMRVHKSWMVALDKIDHVERDRIVIGEARIPVSESYRERFFAAIQG